MLHFYRIYSVNWSPFFVCVVDGKTHPSTPAMYKFRPTFGTMPKVHYHTAGEKVRHPLFGTYVRNIFIVIVLLRLVALPYSQGQ